MKSYIPSICTFTVGCTTGYLYYAFTSKWPASLMNMVQTTSYPVMCHVKPHSKMPECNINGDNHI